MSAHGPLDTHTAVLQSCVPIIGQKVSRTVIGSVVNLLQISFSGSAPYLKIGTRQIDPAKDLIGLHVNASNRAIGAL